MSSYLSSLLTSTTSHYASLRRQLLPNESDGDTEDDSHITRVLRAYYTEKSRPLPPWLPPDPKKAAVLAAAPSSQPAIGSSYGSLWGNSQPTQPAYYPSQGSSGGAGQQRTGLSDLWDSPPAQQRSQTPTSLRGGGRQAPQQLAPPANVRPLPSQRAGSYQSHTSALSARGRQEASSPYGAAGGGAALQPQHTGGSTGSGGGGSTAQERLKARLWGQSTGGSGGRPASPAGSQGGYGSQGRFGDGGGGGGGGGRWG